MRLTEEQIKCAVDWWKNVLKRPKFDTLGQTRRNPENESAAFAELMASAYHKEPDAELVERFGMHLANVLRGLDKPTYGYADLSVDYDPCQLLYDAWLAAGGQKYTMLIFPWKTVMWFKNGGVQVRYGYGAETQELLREKITDEDC